jgi:hypothetical protein
MLLFRSCQTSHWTPTQIEGAEVVGNVSPDRKRAVESSQPRSRLEKLGVKAGYKVVLLGLDDSEFASELAGGGAEVVSGSMVHGADLVFLRVETSDDLLTLWSLREIVKPDVAVWTLRRKGRKDLTEGDVMQAGLDAGFVDVKVVRFSDTLTAEKFVIRLVERTKR